MPVNHIFIYLSAHYLPMKKRKSLKKPQIKAIIFDIGGVLELNTTPLVKRGKGVFRHKGVHEYVSQKLGISLDQYFDSIDTYYTKSMEGQISEEKTLQNIAQNLKISQRKTKRLFKRAYAKNFQTNKELYKEAFKLKKKGYKIAILSDQWYLSKHTHLKPKYTKKFDTVVVSCDVGIRKPNPKIYRLTLKKLKVRPKEAIFVDNQLWNIKPAKKLGIKTILFKNNNQCLKELKKLGVEI